MRVSYKDRALSFEGRQSEVEVAFNRFIREGATSLVTPTPVAGEEYSLAVVEVISDRLVYLAIRVVAHSLKCAIYMDVVRPHIAHYADGTIRRYTKSQTVRIKGDEAHNPQLAHLALLLPVDMPVRLYKSGNCPVLRINLTHFDIVKERSHDIVR